MLIGVPKEVKTQEYRVGLVPGSVRELVHHSHSVFVEAGAGLGTGFGDEAYAGAGAAIAGAAAEVFAKADMIVKVKVPFALRTNSLHLSASRCGSAPHRRFTLLGGHLHRL